MAVPSSFNDLTQESSLRDYVGWVWYERTVTLPPFAPSGNSSNYWLHFESAHYYAMVVSVRGCGEESTKCCVILSLLVVSACCAVGEWTVHGRPQRRTSSL